MHFYQPAEYQERTEKKYRALKNRLLTAIPFADVEHIGSSAIRGAVSKGDLDVLVRVGSADFARALEAIETLGFAIKNGTLRTESLCMLEGPEETAVQLIERGSKFEMFVRFRGLLNANPELVGQYNSLKMSCVGLSADDYRTRKSAFIESVIGTWE